MLITMHFRLPLLLLGLVGITTLAAPLDTAILPTPAINSNFPLLNEPLLDEPLPVFRAQALFCETSAASPAIVFAHQAANNLIKERALLNCVQGNQTGSKCTWIKAFNGADISMCGGWRKSLKCTTVAWAIKHIADKCQVNGKGGGYYTFEVVGVNVVLH